MISTFVSDMNFILIFLGTIRHEALNIGIC
jgi:hypothetical protein